MTDWAPTWDYQWWKDIAIPAVSAFGALGIGVGSVWLAGRSQRFVADVNRREEAAKEREVALTERGARADAVGPIHAWVEGYWRADTRAATDARRFEVAQAIAATPNGQTLMDAMEDLAMQRQNQTEGEESAQLRALLRHFTHSWVQNPTRWTEVSAVQFAKEPLRKRAQELVTRWQEGRYEQMYF